MFILCPSDRSRITNSRTKELVVVCRITEVESLESMTLNTIDATSFTEVLTDLL